MSKDSNSKSKWSYSEEKLAKTQTTHKISNTTGSMATLHVQVTVLCHLLIV